MAFVVRLTEEETEGLRKLAELEHRSMHEVAKLAITERVSRVAQFAQDDAKVDRIIARDADLLDRLAK